jgi:hypothetical protein
MKPHEAKEMIGEIIDEVYKLGKEEGREEIVKLVTGSPVKESYPLPEPHFPTKPNGKDTLTPTGRLRKGDIEIFIRNALRQHPKGLTGIQIQVLTKTGMAKAPHISTITKVLRSEVENLRAKKIGHSDRRRIFVSL